MTEEQKTIHPIPGRKYKIIYDKEGCIGAGACEAVAPLFWKVIDYKATLIPNESQKSEVKEELIITSEDFKIHLDAAEACPVRVIKIFDLETDEQVFP